MLFIDCIPIDIILLLLVVMSTKLRKVLGDRVRQLRKQRGYSQESFAEAAGLHRTYIGAIERGEQNVSLDNIGHIAQTLKIKIANLFV